MILVTAAGGTVGAAALKELRRSQQPVRAGCHSDRGAAAAAAEGAEVARIDLAEPATLGRALAGVESVLLVSATGPEQTRQELNLVAAANDAGVQRIVKLSVWRADELLTPIAQAHRPVERAIESSGLRWTFLRPNFYMQNFARQAASTIRTDGVIAQPVSDAAISFIDARDVASCAAHVLSTHGHDRHVYSLTGPTALSYSEAAEVFSTVLGKPVRFIGLSDEQARAGMLRAGIRETHADALLAVSRAYRRGGADAVLPTVRELIGRDPIALAQFVSDHRDLF
jgi:uncharacterized protein YbjT (DUF2867 family)